MAIEMVKEACAGMTWIEPTSPEYVTARQIFHRDSTAVPLAIVQPNSSQEVSKIVAAARKHGVKITVQVGGHQLTGKCIEQDALTINLRKINFVQVASDKKSATVGGGAFNIEVGRALHAEGLTTPMATLGTVGYAGWAMYGGYGGLMNHFGLGVDQILAAEVVNWEGEIIEANEEVLKAIRGGGGNFGIITSLKIKAYPLKSILVGTLIYDSEDLASACKNFLTAMRTNTPSWPSAMQLQPGILNYPPGNKSLIVLFLWSSSDLEEGYRTLDKVISSTPKISMKTVTETSYPDFLEETAVMIPKTAYGRIETASFETLEDDVLDILAQYAEKMPLTGGTMMFLHSLSPNSPSAEAEPEGRASTFAVRHGHTMVEIIGIAFEEVDLEQSQVWATQFRDALRAPGKHMEETYVSLTPPGDRKLSQVYGAKWEEIKRLKDKYDPEGLFDLAFPRVRSGMS